MDRSVQMYKSESAAVRYQYNAKILNAWWELEDVSVIMMLVVSQTIYIQQ